jgi:AGCS family alanine or glycine:cation symporter
VFWQIGKEGSVSDGLVHYIRKDPKRRRVGKCIGTFRDDGNFDRQSNSIVVAFRSFGIDYSIAPVALNAIVAAVVVGGLKRIAEVSRKIVPLKTMLSLSAATIALLTTSSKMPHLFSMILYTVFASTSILGAAAGIRTMIAASVGVSRGISAYEAGLWSTTIAAAKAKTNSPTKPRLVSMVECYSA